MDVPTTLFLFLGVALAIYIIVMIEAATSKPGDVIKKAKEWLKQPDEVFGKHADETETGEEGEAQETEATPTWPPPEEEKT